MIEVSTIGLDIAKSVFQVHGVDVAGAVVIRKRVSRAKVLEYFGELPPGLVGIEACPSAHHWGRELQGLGHTVKLIPPSYVKAYLKRSKNDANDAAAICEAVTRPSMRFVPIKTKEQQAALMLHRTGQLLVRQRTMLSNAYAATWPNSVSCRPRAAMEREICSGSSRMVRRTGFPQPSAAFSMCWRGSTARSEPR
jgi:transposase